MKEVDKTKDNLKKCKCMNCPSYTDTCKVKNAPENLLKLMGDFSKHEHYEKMFCAFERSNCIEEDNGCLCEDCEVFKNYNLNRNEFCLKTGGRNEFKNV